MAEFTIVKPPPDGKEVKTFEYSILKFSTSTGELWVRFDLSKSDMASLRSIPDRNQQIDRYKQLYATALGRFEPVLNASTHSVPPAPAFEEANSIRETDPKRALALYIQAYHETGRLPVNPEWKSRVHKAVDNSKIEGKVGQDTYFVSVGPSSVIVSISHANGTTRTLEFSNDLILKQINRQGIFWTGDASKDIVGDGMHVVRISSFSLVKYLFKQDAWTNGPVISEPSDLVPSARLIVDIGPKLVSLLVGKGVLKEFKDPSFPKGMQVLYYDPRTETDSAHISQVLSKKGLTEQQIITVLRQVFPGTVLETKPRLAAQTDGAVELSFGKNPNGTFPFEFVTTDGKRVSLSISVSSAWIASRTDQAVKDEIRRQLDGALVASLPVKADREMVVKSIIDTPAFGGFLEQVRKQAATKTTF